MAPNHRHWRTNNRDRELYYSRRGGTVLTSQQPLCQNEWIVGGGRALAKLYPKLTIASVKKGIEREQRESQPVAKIFHLVQLIGDFMILACRD